MSHINFDRLCKQYAGAAHATIQNANLDIAAGEFCVFVGPSGCGKSTLLRMVAGLEDITSGDIAILGKRVNDLPPAQRGVAMVFQSYALYPHMTVRENMGFGLRTAGMKADQVAQKVLNAAASLQLTTLLDRLPKQLSGGQRQRVAIGRAIVKEPSVFLFDEPLSNLDAALRVQTRLEIAKLHKQIGHASMIYVTHDQVEAMTLADKIVLLRAGPDVQTLGSVAQVGSPLALYHRPASRFVAEFIGSPKMNIFAAHLRHADAHGAQVQVGGQALTAQVDARHLIDRAQQPLAVDVGIRPEDMVLLDAQGTAQDNCMMGIVEHIERLGESTLLYLRLQTSPDKASNPDASDLWTVKVPGSNRQNVGDVVRVHCPASAWHCFDSQGNACQRLGVSPD